MIEGQFGLQQKYQHAYLTCQQHNNITIEIIQINTYTSQFNRCNVPNKLAYSLFKNLMADGTNDLRYLFDLAIQGKVYTEKNNS